MEALPDDRRTLVGAGVLFFMNRKDGRYSLALPLVVLRCAHCCLHPSI
jgi:hypothetical protein